MAENQNTPARHFLSGTNENVVEKENVSHFTRRSNLLHNETVVNEVPRHLSLVM